MAAGDPKNYEIGTGKVYFLDDAALSLGEQWLGNCPSVSITNDITTKDHFRSWGGQRTKDVTIITTVGSTIDLSLDEISAQAVAMFALGTLDNTANSDGSYTITALTNTRFTGILHIVGDNDAGPTLEFEGRVSMQPSGQLFLIQDNDDWNKIPIKCTIENDASTGGLGMGVWTVHPAA